MSSSSSTNRQPTLREAFEELKASDGYWQLTLPVRLRFQQVASWWPERDAQLPLANVNAAFAKMQRDRAARERGYKFGNYALLMLQAIIKAAIDAGVLSRNRVAQVPRLLPPRQHSTQRRSIPIRHRISARTDLECEKSRGKV
jgi:hypothetical protein